MQLHGEHCLDEPFMTKCAQAWQGCKISIKQDITVQSPDDMVGVWQSMADWDQITPSTCRSFADSIAHVVCLQLYLSDILHARRTIIQTSVTKVQAFSELAKLSISCWFRNFIAHRCLWHMSIQYRHAISSIMFNPDWAGSSTPH